MNKDYELLKLMCEKEGCYCPKEYECHRKEANEPLWFRIWCGIRYKSD